MAKKKKSWSSDSIDSKMASSEGSTGGALEKAVNTPVVKKKATASPNAAKFMNQVSKKWAPQIEKAFAVLEGGGSIADAIKGVPADARSAVKAYGRSLGV